jgi:hypothetical protein
MNNINPNFWLVIISVLLLLILLLGTGVAR